MADLQNADSLSMMLRNCLWSLLMLLSVFLFCIRATAVLAIVMRDVRFQGNINITRNETCKLQWALKERLLLLVLREPADECDVRLQLNGKYS